MSVFAYLCGNLYHVFSIPCYSMYLCTYIYLPVYLFSSGRVLLMCPVFCLIICVSINLPVYYVSQLPNHVGLEYRVLLSVEAGRLVRMTQPAVASTYSYICLSPDRYIQCWVLRGDSRIT